MIPQFPSSFERQARHGHRIRPHAALVAVACIVALGDGLVLGGMFRRVKGSSTPEADVIRPRDLLALRPRRRQSEKGAAWPPFFCSRRARVSARQFRNVSLPHVITFLTASAHKKQGLGVARPRLARKNRRAPPCDRVESARLYAVANAIFVVVLTMFSRCCWAAVRLPPFISRIGEPRRVALYPVFVLSSPDPVHWQWALVCRRLLSSASSFTWPTPWLRRRQAPAGVCLGAPRLHAFISSSSALAGAAFIGACAPRWPKCAPASARGLRAVPFRAWPAFFRLLASCAPCRSSDPVPYGVPSRRAHRRRNRWLLRFDSFPTSREKVASCAKVSSIRGIAFA